jgi:hypothetical protein
MVKKIARNQINSFSVYSLKGPEFGNPHEQFLCLVLKSSKGKSISQTFRKPWHSRLLISLIQERDLLDIRFFYGSDGSLTQQRSTFRKILVSQSRNLMQRADSWQVKQQMWARLHTKPHTQIVCDWIAILSINHRNETISWNVQLARYKAESMTTTKIIQSFLASANLWLVRAWKKFILDSYPAGVVW